MDKLNKKALGYDEIVDGLKEAGYSVEARELSKLGIEPGKQHTFHQFASALIDWQKTQGCPRRTYWSENPDLLILAGKADWRRWCEEAFLSFDEYGSGVINPGQILERQETEDDAMRFTSFECFPGDGQMETQTQLMAVLRNGSQEAGDEYIDLSEFMSVLQTGEANSLELYDRRLVDWDADPHETKPPR